MITEGFESSNSDSDSDYDSAVNRFKTPDQDLDNENPVSPSRIPTLSLIKVQKQERRKSKVDKNFLKVVLDAESKLSLGGDAYALAFKAFNLGVIKELNMNMDEVHNAFHAAMFVFGFQLLMIIFVGTVIFTDDYAIKLPVSLTVLGARFVCTILMHLQVEGDMRQGLRMMKYVTNQPFDFTNPTAAFFVALMQCLGGLFAELACIYYLSK